MISKEAALHAERVYLPSLRKTSTVWLLWHYWFFKTRDTKLERFLHKNEHTERKLLNFENLTNGEPQ